MRGAESDRLADSGRGGYKQPVMRGAGRGGGAPESMFWPPYRASRITLDTEASPAMMKAHEVLSLDVDDVDVILCPQCRTALELNQLDKAEPDQIVALCPACSRLILVHAVDEEWTRAVALVLPTRARSSWPRHRLLNLTVDTRV